MSAAEDSTCHARTNTIVFVSEKQKKMLKALQQPNCNLWDREVRKDIFKLIRVMCMSFLIILVLAATITALLYGVTWNPSKYFPRRINVIIVDQDGGLYSELLTQSIASTRTLKWQIRPNITNPEDYVHDGHAWAAVVIPSGYSQNITNSLQGEPYQNPFTFIVDEGRSLSTATSIRTILFRTVTTIGNNYSIALIQSNPAIASVAPANLIVRPFYYFENNLSPVRSSGQEVSAGLGLLYLFLIAVALVNASLSAWGPLMTRVKVYQTMIAKIVQLLLLTAIVAIMITGIILIYGFSPVHGWAIYWLFLWLIFLTFCTIVSSFIVTLGAFSTFAIPIFLFLNYTASGGAVPTALSNGFYKIGYGLPMFHAVQGGRYIIFNSVNRIAINIGVLLAWSGACLLFVTAVQILKLYKLITKAPDEVQTAFEDVGQPSYASSDAIRAEARRPSREMYHHDCRRQDNLQNTGA